MLHSPSLWNASWEINASQPKIDMSTWQLNHKLTEQQNYLRCNIIANLLLKDTVFTIWLDEPNFEQVGSRTLYSKQNQMSKSKKFHAASKPLFLKPSYWVTVLHQWISDPVKLTCCSITLISLFPNWFTRLVNHLLFVLSTHSLAGISFDKTFGLWIEK